MTIKEHLSNFNATMQSYLTDNGYDLDKEPEDEGSFADELESAAEQAVTEFRDSIGDEDEDEDEDTASENEEPPAHKE